MPVSRYKVGFGEPEVREVLSHEFGHLCYAYILRRDRRLSQPALNGREMIGQFRVYVLVNGRVIMLVARNGREVIGFSRGQLIARPARFLVRRILNMDFAAGERCCGTEH